MVQRTKENAGGMTPSKAQYGFQGPRKPISVTRSSSRKEIQAQGWLGGVLRKMNILGYVDFVDIFFFRGGGGGGG